MRHFQNAELPEALPPKSHIGESRNTALLNTNNIIAKTNPPNPKNKSTISTNNPEKINQIQKKDPQKKTPESKNNQRILHQIQKNNFKNYPKRSKENQWKLHEINENQRNPRKSMKIIEIYKRTKKKINENFSTSIKNQ